MTNRMQNDTGVEGLTPSSGFFPPKQEIKPTLPYTHCVFFSTANIVDLKVDAIVNAANPELLAGSGVCGVIFNNSDRRKLQSECLAKAPCATGECVLTNSYSKSGNYKYIIHAVGPVGEKPTLLSKVYTSILDCCVKNGLKEVAIPCISTGIYGYPEESACIVVLSTIKKWLERNPDKMSKIILDLFTADSVKYYRKHTNTIFSGDSEGEE